MKFNARGRRARLPETSATSSLGKANTAASFRLASGSSTLGFAYGDWCASQVASGLGHTTDAEMRSSHALGTGETYGMPP